MADYAISNVPRRVVYAASGTGPYAFTFEILNQTDIAVYKASTLLTLTTDYTVIINANGTGSVTLVLTAGTSNITIVGAKNIQRTTDFTTGGDLFANTLNDELDNQTIYIQQVAETAERGLKAPVTDPTDIAMTLPAKSGRAGKVLAFDSTTGNPVAGPSLDAVVTVIEQSANINTVAANIASVNTVAGNTSNINTVAGVSGNVTTVAGSISNVNTVANDLNEAVSEINTVAVNIANVNAVGTNISNVNAVAGNETNINSVVSNATNINAVAGNATNINAVNSNSTNINTVATNIANVNNVGGNIANVNQVAADTTVINSASANAATATTKAAEALASANSAATSAAAASAVALGSEPVRHSVRPSLLLDFANTKTLDPRITFTRASTATFYDGKTVAKAEENFFRYSQEFDNAYWTKTNVTVTANSDVAPDGTTTADTISATANDGRLLQTSSEVTVTSGLTYTISAWIRRKTGTGTVQFYCLQAPAGGFSGDLGITSTWARYTFTFTANSTGANTRLFQLGTSGDEVYVWGAQMEQRSSVTAYTATTTAPITNYIPALQTAAAGVARFEHNPVTGESLGLEIEEQRTNRLLQSEDLSTTWANTRSSDSTNVVISPNGTLTGDKLIEDATASNSHFILSGFVSSTSGTYTASVYLKAAERSFAFIGITDLLTGGAERRINLSTGVVDSTNIGGAGSWTSISGTSTSVGNGWYRVTVTATQGAGTLLSLQIYTGNASGAQVYTGDGYSGIYIWGAQLEAGAFATSYIPTVASQVTRSADSASMTGTNFSSWYRADEGTVYIESSITPNSNGAYMTLANGSSATGYIDIQRHSLTSNTRSLGSNTLSITETTASSTSSMKTALALKTNDCSMSVNGNTSIADTSTTQLSDLSELQIGRYSTSFANVSIKKFAYYPKRLTNAELQGVTTV